MSFFFNLFNNLASQISISTIASIVTIVCAVAGLIVFLRHHQASSVEKWKTVGTVSLIVVVIVAFLLWPRNSSSQANQSSLGNLLYTDRGHNGDISSIAWSPDGKRIASGSQNDGTVQVWDATTGTNRLTHHDVFFAWDTEGVAGLAWSPDGKYIASTTRFSVDIWDATTGKSLRTKSGYFIRDLAWLSDGTHLTFVDTGSTLHIWDITTGQDNTYHPDGSKATYNDIAWSPDDSLIAYSNDKGFAVRDFPSWHVEYTYYCNCSHVDSISWAPNGRYLLAIITTQSKTTSKISTLIKKVTEYWDDNSSDVQINCSVQIPKQSGVIPGITFGWAPNSRYLAFSCHNIIYLYDMNTNHTITAFSGHKAAIEITSTWSPDGRFIASGGDDGIVQVWQTM